MVEDGRLESKSFLKGKDMVYVYSCDFQGWLVEEVYSFVVVIDGIMHYKWCMKVSYIVMALLIQACQKILLRLIVW